MHSREYLHAFEDDQEDVESRRGANPLSLDKYPTVFHFLDEIIKERKDDNIKEGKLAEFYVLSLTETCRWFANVTESGCEDCMGGRWASLDIQTVYERIRNRPSREIGRYKM